MSSTEFEGLSFEERVNKIVDKRLGDPTRFPSEYRSWLPKWIETQNIQLPISQVQGLYLTAENATNLGGDVHGRIGMIRGGSSPYDFIQVTFDSIYGKWVSDPSIFCSQIQTVFSTTNTTYTIDDKGTLGISNWLTFDTAGLKPQFRFFAVIAITGGATATAILAFQSYDAAGTGNGIVEDAAFTVTTTGATAALKFTNWTDLPAGVTLDDYLVAAAEIKSSSGAQTATIAAFNAWIRWVSK